MYETINELHIEIEQRIQQITSNRYGSMPPQFYDMMLNRTAIKYIQSKSNRKTNYKGEGLEDSMKRVEDFQSLKRETPWLNVIRQTDDESDSFDKSRGFVKIPSDCLKFISSTSHLKYEKNIKDKDYNIISESDEDKPYKNIFYCPIEISGISTIKIQSVNDNANYIEADISSLRNHFDIEYELPKYIVDYLHNVFNDKDLHETSSGSNRSHSNKLSGHINIYWETFDNRFYKNSIIISSDKNIEIFINDEKIDTYNYTNECFPSGTLDKHAKNDLIASENIQSTLDNPYGNKNRHLNPITELIDDKLYVYQGNDFYVGKIKITYLKKPRLFSSDLNQMSDMTITPEFVDMVVSDILLILKDNTFNLVKQQTNIE